MRLAPFIAGRYLFARKSHNVINVISAISAIGMAIGTAALVLILSVYNGFDKIIKDNMSDVDADYIVRTASGKRFEPSGEILEWLQDRQEVASVGKVLEENVFILHEGNQAIASARGVDSVYVQSSGMHSHLLLGNWSLRDGDLPLAAIGSELSSKLNASPNFRTPIVIYYPSTEGQFSPSNPTASLRKEKMLVGSILSVNAEMDAGLLIVPIETMSSLLGCGDEVSRLEVRLAPGLSGRQTKAFAKALSEKAGNDFKVLDRYRQHATLYRMMRYEKAAIWFILMFVVVIVALNIFGSLSMLIIEKEDDIATLHALGADDSLIRRIFILEGWMVSLLGMLIGLVIGVVLALLQQHLGLVKMPGNFIVDAYPVVLQWGDVLLTAAGVALIGLLVALAPALRKATGR